MLTKAKARPSFLSRTIHSDSTAKGLTRHDTTATNHDSGAAGRTVGKTATGEGEEPWEMATFWNNNKSDNDKNEIVSRLTTEVVQLRERNESLEEELRAAIGGRKAAVDKIRDLEDILRLKESLESHSTRHLTSLTSQLTTSESLISSLQSQLLSISLERSNHPLSDLDLQYRYGLLKGLLEEVRDSLSCPVCYEAYGKGKGGEGGRPVSLLCGHSFCEGCWKEWEDKHLQYFRLSPQQGAYTGPDCPECRSSDVRRGKVRIWAMEEVVRVVERGCKGLEGKEAGFVPDLGEGEGGKRSPEPVVGTDVGEDEGMEVEEPIREAETTTTDRSTPSPPSPPLHDPQPELVPEQAAPHPDPEEMEGSEADEELDEDALSILRPRTPLPYGGSARG